jgi:hypothetical protein
MMEKIRRSKFLQFLLGFMGWLILWTAFYVIAEAVDPRPNLGGSIMLILIVTVIHPAVILLLFLTRLRWAVLGYAAAMLLNVGGQFILFNLVLDTQKVVISGITYYTRYIRGSDSLLSYLWFSIPFFLPVGFGP